jgi:hypothetical protein
MQVYGDNAMNKTAVYMWVTHFSEGTASVTDEEGSGWPATSRTEENITKVRQIVRENPSAECKEHCITSEHRHRNS